jgi:hypothetical protein
MSYVRSIWSCLFASLAVITVAATPAAAQQQQKPNIFFIIADDIGWMQVQATRWDWKRRNTEHRSPRY